MENIVQIREFDEARDTEMVGKLEKSCEIGSKNGVALFTSMMITDPLCRIRLYAVHVMLVAELLEDGELVGVVRGCIKSCVGTQFEGQIVKLGCILGLRVSPRHRRVGIGFELLKSAEEWMMKHGADYTFLATEKNNVASTNLFTTKCNYINFSSLVICVQPIVSSPRLLGRQDIIKTEKLQLHQAISLYNTKLRSKDLYPTDIDSILKENLSLGTWVSYFKDDQWLDFEDDEGAPSSWVMFSIWNNSSEACKIQISHHPHPFFKFLHASLTHAKDKIFHFLRLVPMCSSPGANGNVNPNPNPFGFLLLYGLYGEGERLGELMKSVFRFASRLADEDVKRCKVIVTELGVSDPLVQYVPRESSTSYIHDLWYLKKVNRFAAADDGDNHEENRTMTMMMMGQLSNVFVDPRDF